MTVETAPTTEKKQGEHLVQLWTDAGWETLVGDVHPTGPHQAKKMAAARGLTGKYRVLKVVDEFEVIEKQQPVYEVK